MITLLVLISLISSNVQSDELQSLSNLMIAVETLDTYHRVPATAFYYNVTAQDLLTNSQLDVVWLQIECEARPEYEDIWQRQITNRTKEIFLLERYRLRDNVDCANETTFTYPHHHCLCDNSSSLYYCRTLEARDITAKRRSRAVEKMGEKLPCADELWEEAKIISNSNIGTTAQLNRIVEYHTKIMRKKICMTSDKLWEHPDNSTVMETYCLFTLPLHHTLRKLRHVDIRFRIFDDLLKMKFLAKVPFDFCTRDYFLSKCLCDERSSSVFCLNYFFKQAALVFVNQNGTSICDDYSSALTSSAPNHFSYSIIVITLSLLRG